MNEVLSGIKVRSQEEAVLCARTEVVTVLAITNPSRGVDSCFLACVCHES
jgi:hypothetical protein